MRHLDYCGSKLKAGSVILVQEPTGAYLLAPMRNPKSCYILRKWAPSGAGKACGENWVVGFLAVEMLLGGGLVLLP